MLPERPQIFVTPRARKQWELILANDFTLPKGSFLRIQIDGKGCDGFTYAVGITAKKENDVEIMVDQGLLLLMDSFTAFYVHEATLDYIQDFSQNEEGFIVVNHHQMEYQGKFWVEDESKIPPLPPSGQ